MKSTVLLALTCLHRARCDDLYHFRFIILDDRVLRHSEEMATAQVANFLRRRKWTMGTKAKTATHLSFFLVFVSINNRVNDVSSNQAVGGTTEEVTDAVHIIQIASLLFRALECKDGVITLPRR